jgi:hypothetical protein
MEKSTADKIGKGIWGAGKLAYRGTKGAVNGTMVAVDAAKDKRVDAATSRLEAEHRSNFADSRREKGRGCDCPVG